MATQPDLQRAKLRYLALINGSFFATADGILNIVQLDDVRRVGAVSEVRRSWVCPHPYQHEAFLSLTVYQVLCFIARAKMMTRMWLNAFELGLFI